MGRSIIMTGATGNLGSAVTKKLLAEGYKLHITITPGETPPRTGGITAKVVDLFNEHECAVMVEEVADTGSDIAAGIFLVGGFAMGSLTETSISSIDAMIRLNFYTAFAMVKPLFEHFEKKGGGHIILIGARPALKPKQGKHAAAYALSKSMIFHLAELINESGKEKNIKATVIVPSTIDTTANRLSMPNADHSKWVSAENIADVIAFTIAGSGAALRESVLKVYGEA